MFSSFLRLLVEYLDEESADNLALFFRILDALQRSKKSIRRVNADHVDVHMFGEGLHDLVTFVMTQQAVVNEYADELIADRLVQQRCNNRRIDTAGQAE